MAREIGFEEYNNEVLKSDKFVLIDFFATWCGPCKMLAPVIEQVANDNEDVMVVKVDVDKNPELAVLYKVASIPTLVLLKDGKPLKEHIGFASKAEIESMISQYK